jgi:hypothetical protein
MPISTMPTPAEWNILARLFAVAGAPYRHQMGLSRLRHQDFYAASATAESIHAEKCAILDSAGAAQYFFDSAAGLPAGQEFLALVGCGHLTTDTARERATLNRLATIALEPDFLLLSPPDWKLVWASVCFPTRWSLAGKGQQPLGAIHAIVPELNAEIGRKIGVFFDRLAVDDGWTRANWGLCTGTERNQHPSQPYQPLSLATPLEDVSVRIESQHLLKLPATGAIAFGIRILHFPVIEVLARPDSAAGLKERLRTMPPAMSAYKGIPTDFWQRLPGLRL